MLSNLTPILSFLVLRQTCQEECVTPTSLSSTHSLATVLKHLAHHSLITASVMITSNTHAVKPQAHFRTHSIWLLSSIPHPWPLSHLRLWLHTLPVFLLQFSSSLGIHCLLILLIPTSVSLPVIPAWTKSTTCWSQTLACHPWLIPPHHSPYNH